MTPPSLLAVPLAGPTKNSEFRLAPGDTIGRGADCSLRLPHKSVSRVHARVEWREGAWFVVDADSRNGVHTRGSAVRELRLVGRHAVRFGDYPVRIEVDSTAARPAPIDEDLEFAVELEGLGDRIEDQDDAGFELEDPAESEPGATRRARAPELEEPVDAARPARASERAAAPASSLDPRAALVHEARRSQQGLLRGDLTQQPAWLQAAVFLAGAALTGGLAWLAFELVRQSRG